MLIQHAVRLYPNKKKLLQNFTKGKLTTPDNHIRRHVLAVMSMPSMFIELGVTLNTACHFHV